MRPATRYIHDFQDPDPVTGAVTVPITMVATFKQDGLGKPRGGLGVRPHGKSQQAVPRGLPRCG